MTSPFMRIALLNGPWGHEGEGLLPQPARTKAIPALLNRHRAQAMVWPEFASDHIGVWRDLTKRHKHWKTLLVPEWNHSGPHKKVTTAMIVRDDLKVVDWMWLTFDPGGRLGPLHFPVALLRQRTTGWQKVTIGGHIWTRDAAGAAARLTANNLLQEYGDYIWEVHRTPVDFLADRNDGHRPPWRWDELNQHGVDWHLGRGLRASNQVVRTEGVTGRISDRHSLLVTTVRPAGRVAPALRSLPESSSLKVTRPSR